MHPYQCPYCLRYFSTEFELRRHRLKCRKAEHMGFSYYKYKDRHEYGWDDDLYSDHTYDLPSPITVIKLCSECDKETEHDPNDYVCRSCRRNILA